MNENVTIVNPSPKGIKKYYPLIAMITIVVAITLGVQYVAPIDNPMRYFMAAFFAVFGVLKVARIKSFAMAYSKYDLVAAHSRLYAHIYPFLEIAFAVAYFVNWQPQITNWVVLIVMIISALGVLNKLVKREKIQCACLGTVFKLPMTWVTLVEDLAMAAMAAMLLF